MKGYDPDGIAQTEADHLMSGNWCYFTNYRTPRRMKRRKLSGECPACGEWFDMRDLGQVIEHVHDAEIEVCEGLAPTRDEQLQ